MRVYHGASARFPIRELTSGLDTATPPGQRMPGLWLTGSPELAAQYASWTADCSGDKLLPVIALELAMDCPHQGNPMRPQDFLVRYPEREYGNGRLKIITAHRVRRRMRFNSGHRF